MSLSGFTQIDQVSLVMSVGGKRPQWVYNVREEWCVMFFVCYVRDGLYPLFVRDGLCCLVRDLYLDRYNIGNILYMFFVRSLR